MSDPFVCGGRFWLTLGLVVLGFFSPAALGFCMIRVTVRTASDSQANLFDCVQRCSMRPEVLGRAMETGARSHTVYPPR